MQFYILNEQKILFPVTVMGRVTGIKKVETDVIPQKNYSRGCMTKNENITFAYQLFGTIVRYSLVPTKLNEGL